MTERELLNSIIGKKIPEINSLDEFGDYTFNYYSKNRFYHNNEDNLILLDNNDKYWDVIKSYKAVNLSEKINDLNRYFLTFNLGARLDGLSLDNFYIGIKGLSVEDCLCHLVYVHNLSFKDCFVSNQKPALLRPAKIIHNCYSNYIIEKKVNSIKKTFEKKNIINMEEIL